ncbi:MAG: UDP-3-O-acyl-N-acetylglucosamine deacetylase [Leptospiraceae bacterium]|nr:UDP-3-O-acyl-N-acetylglucosamine deacetylase [Leptospiraceae bacterium]MCK6380784.1 UDP-3-O-acyl-N-acetylglucosamine deacetylase [Leptospiraceae bacterium]NUM40499.1 UDP-3-O-acyl-N-acetylglucosamine deacetylase [Leptospiraceae bacterium]
MKEYRKTIKNSGTITGIGLHSGKNVNLRLFPAEENTGLIFRTNSSKKVSEIKVALENVVDTSNAVTLGDGHNVIQTIEHLLAALYTLGITDLIMEIDAIEIPILDGSSLPFVQAIEDLGFIEFQTEIQPIKIQNPLWVVDGDKYLVVLPSDELKVSYNIDFKHPLLRGQSYTTKLNREILKNEILPARTFGFLRDVEALQARGLALGGSIENAVVLTDTGFLNDNLRFENECVRHKILDLIGDLSIVGRPIIGHFLASKAGHALDVSLGKYILSKISGDEISKFKSRRVPLFQKRKSISKEA